MTGQRWCGLESKLKVNRQFAGRREKQIHATKYIGGTRNPILMLAFNLGNNLEKKKTQKTVNTHGTST